MPSRPRLYDTRRWRRERKAFLWQSPFCVLCKALDQITQATVVDHIRPHRGNPDLFWDWSNWQPVCKPCHDGAKQQMEKSGGLRGSDHEGQPVDPTHHWNR